MLETLQSIDAEILLWINGMHSPMADSAITLLTGRLIWLPLYIACFILMARRFGWRRSLFFLIAMIAAVAVADWITHDILKHSIARMRPSNPQNPLSASLHIVNDIRGGKYSFPSSHAVNSFTFIAMMGLLMRRRWIWAALTAWGLLNCYTRLYLGVHYPSDIICGIAVGLAMGTCAYFAMTHLAALDKNKWKRLIIRTAGRGK